MSGHNEKYDRNRQIVEQYRRGESIVRIGKQYGISKQRVFQILKAMGER